MNKINSYNNLIIIGIVLSLLISNFTIICFSIETSIDKDDGVYYIDKFYDGINVNLEKCKTKKLKNYLPIFRLLFLIFRIKFKKNDKNGKKSRN